MWKAIFPLLMSTILVACAPTGSSDPFNNPGADDLVDAPDSANDELEVPENIAENLVSYDFSGDGSTLTLELRMLDTTPVEAVYSREPSLDLEGYLAYSVQEDPLDRFFVALAGESLDGTVNAVVAGDGGQFNRVFRGARYNRTGDYNPPTPDSAPGLVSYVGDYAGVTNIIDVDGRLLLPIPAEGSGVDRPGQPWLVEGKVFVNVDFSDAGINGQIYERILIPSSDGFAPRAMETLILLPDNIEENGTFGGGIENNRGSDSDNVGTFAGLFGGPNAENIAGGIEIADPSRDSPAYLESGVFILGRCGTAATSDPVCDAVQPTP